MGGGPELGLHFIGLGVGIALSGVVVIATVGHMVWDAEWLVLAVVGMFFFIPAWFWLPVPAGDTASCQSTSPVPGGRWMLLLTLAYFCAGSGFAVGAIFIVAILEKLPALAGQGGRGWVLVGVAATPSASCA